VGDADVEQRDTTTGSHYTRKFSKKSWEIYEIS